MRPSCEPRLGPYHHPCSFSLYHHLLSCFTACRYSVVGNSPAHLSTSLHDCILPQPAHSFSIPSGLVYAFFFSFCLFYHQSFQGNSLCFFLVSFGWLDANSLIFAFIVWSGLWRIPKERWFNLFGSLSCFDLLAGFALCWELMKGSLRLLNHILSFQGTHELTGLPVILLRPLYFIPVQVHVRLIDHRDSDSDTHPFSV